MMYKKQFISWLKPVLGLAIAAGLYLFFGETQNNETSTTRYKTRLISNLPDHQFILQGKPRLSDGDSMQFGQRSRRARLFGIDSPELAQQCQIQQKNWHCGKQAKAALATKIKSKQIYCVGDKKDKYGRLLATCFLRAKGQNKFENLNAWMVKNGWATAYVYYSNRYVVQQKFAKSNRLGIWQGRFLEPFKWRQKHNKR